MAVVRSAFPAAFIQGLLLVYSSATAVQIGTGSARDSVDSGNVQVSTPLTGTITSTGANGLDSKSLTGTCATDSTNTTVTGTGTAFLTEFAPSNTPRTLTGTIGTGGAASTTITGVGTAFLSEVSIGDLIGSSTVGYSRVTAITSDTSLTVVSNLTITNGHTGKVLENVTLQVAAQTAQRVSAIASDTSLTLPANSSATASGQTAKCGVEIASCLYSVYVIWAPSVAPAAYISTQRTAFFAFPSTYTLRRRVGWIKNGAAGDILQFTCAGENRRLRWEIQVATDGNRVLSAGNATTWTAFSCAALAPPSTSQIVLNAYLSVPTAAGETLMYFRASGIGAAANNRPTFISVLQNGSDASQLAIAPNAAQKLDYALTSGSGNPGYAEVSGFEDNPNLFM